MRILTAIGALCLLAAGGAAIASEDAPAEHMQWMKDLGNQMGALRKGIDVEKNANDMQATLKHVSVFWKARHAEDALAACRQSTDGAAAVAKAAAANDKPAISAGLRDVGAGCKGCHDTHRERVSDKVYKIK